MKRAYGRIPPHAVELYLSMGARRSYARLADELGVSKRSVLVHAKKENWQARLAEFDNGRRAALVAKAERDITSIEERHLTAVRVVQARALETLRGSKHDPRAVRSLLMAQREEERLLGVKARGACVDAYDVKAADAPKAAFPSASDPSLLPATVDRDAS